MELYSTTQWLNSGEVLKQVFDLKVEIYEFMEKMERFNLIALNQSIKAGSGCLVDISTHHNNLNLPFKVKIYWFTISSIK